MLLSLLAIGSHEARADDLGDVNGDGVVNVTDVTLLINRILNSADDDCYLVAADVNSDGVVNVTDVTMLISMLMGAPQVIENKVITVNGVSFKMVLVEGGTFTMGSYPELDPDTRRNESPAHEVTVSSYYIAETEVTQELWLAVMGTKPSYFAGDPKLPVESVSLFDCAIFADRLTSLTDGVFRLPTEAEWEFAARGGNYGNGFFLAGDSDINNVAWYEQNAGETTHAVAGLMPNELGLYDMSGNVAEWCGDFYSGYSPEPQTNPCGPESGYTNVVKSGSWEMDAAGCRVASRFSVDPHEKSFSIGFRLVMNCYP